MLAYYQLKLATPEVVVEQIMLYYQRGIVCRLFLYSIDSVTDSSGGVWLARANSEHTTLYNRAVLFDVSNASNSVIVK